MRISDWSSDVCSSDLLHRPEALLFDLGDLAPLSARDLLRVRHVFVSHMHMDHFIGFDQLLRVNIGRDKQISMVGPAGFAAAVGHKLQAYSWDLVDRYATDLIIDAFEVIGPAEIHGEIGRASGREREFHDVKISEGAGTLK